MKLDAHLVVKRDTFVLDVSFDIDTGETLALLGPNGAGKSTTVQALAGLLPLDGGHLELGGRMLDHPLRDVFVPPEQRNVGVVFQDHLLFDHLSVLDNVAFAPRSRGLSAADAAVQAERWLERLDLLGLRNRMPRDLSGGQSQRVAVARALASEPQLLLLDEAMAALDVATRNELRRTLSGYLQQFEGPRLIITHDPTDAFLLADRIAIIEDGAISQIGSPTVIRQRPATPYVAAVAGTNLLEGTNNVGALRLVDFDHELRTSNTRINGPVLITIHPTAIALHDERPSGSPRNSWRTSVATIEPLGDTTRVTLADPLPLGVDITPAAATAMQLQVGQLIWASVKATEVEVTSQTG